MYALLEAHHWKIRLTTPPSTCVLWENDQDKELFFPRPHSLSLLISFLCPSLKSQGRWKETSWQQECVCSHFYLKLISVGRGELLFWFIYFKTWFLLSCLKTNCILFRSKDFQTETAPCLSPESCGQPLSDIQAASHSHKYSILNFGLIISSPHLESVNK